MRSLFALVSRTSPLIPAQAKSDTSTLRRGLAALVLGLCLTGPAFAQSPAPAANATASLASDRNFVVFFPQWSAAFDSSAEAVIAAAAATAKAHPNDPVLVIGHADPTGTARANALISALRAELVADALIDAGVPAARIEKHAEGETQYVFSAQESRRVTISVGAK